MKHKNETIRVVAMNDGRNPQGIVLEADESGDRGIYNEIRVSALKGEDCVADILVGLDEKGQVRVLVTTGNEGDGDHAVAVYPQSPHSYAVDSDWNC